MIISRRDSSNSLDTNKKSEFLETWPGGFIYRLYHDG